MKQSKFKISFSAICLVLLACLCSSPPNPREAKPIWENSSINYGGWTGYANGIFYIRTGDGYILAWDEMTGAEIWRAEGDSARVGADKTTLYVFANGQCSALDAGSGQIARELTNAEAYLCDIEKRDDSSYMFTVSEDQTLIAADAASSNGLWETNLGLDLDSVFMQPPASEPYIVNGKVVAYSIGYKENDPNKRYLNFQVFDPESGDLLWQIVDKPYGMAYIEENTAYLLYSETGESVSDPGNNIPDPVGQFELTAHDIQTGSELWHTTTSYAYNFYSAGGKLYTCRDGLFRWFDPANGAPLGEKDLKVSCPNSDEENLNLGDDILLVAGNRISDDGNPFNGPYDGWINAYQISSGEIIWSTEIHELDFLTVASLGNAVVMVPWQGGYRGYALTP